MGKRATLKVLEHFIADGSTPTYTGIDYALELGRCRQLGVLVTVQRVHGLGGAQRLDCWIEHSNDGETFVPKSPVNLINDRVIDTTSGTAVVTAGEGQNPRPSGKYVRIGVKIQTGEHTTTSGRVVIKATLRGSRPRKKVAAAKKPVATSAPGSLARADEVAVELRQLAVASASLAPADRAAHLIRNISPSAQEHFRELDRQLLALPEASRRLLLATTGTLLQQALALHGRAPKKEGCCDAPVPGTCGGPGCARE